MNNINISESKFLKNFSEKVLQTSNKDSFSSIFDVHANGVVDEGDFTQNDLSNSTVKTFLSEFLNHNWTKEIENKIADVLNTLNKENFEKDCGKYKIKFENDKFVITTRGKKAEIKVTKDSSVVKEYLQKLIDVLSSLTDEEMEDFINEVNGIKLVYGTSWPGSAGFCVATTDVIELTTEQDGRAINKNTLVHELGHAVSTIHNNPNDTSPSQETRYSYTKDLDKRFGIVDGVVLVLEKIEKEYGSNPCLANKDALFEEYSLYKQGLPTQYHSEALFEKMEQSEDKDVKNLCEILKNPVQKCLEKLFSGITLSEEDIEEISDKEAYKFTCETYFNPVSGSECLLQKLREKYGHAGMPTDEFGDKYCLKNENEFFAEYYLYKMEGVTHHGSEKLFAELAKSDDKDIQDLLKIMESHIEISKQDENFRKVH